MYRPISRTGTFVNLGNSGMTIVEVMIAAGVMLAIMLAMLTLSDSQRKKVKAVYQKTELNELGSQLMQAFANRNVCTWQLVGSPANTIDTTSDPAQSSTVIALPAIYQGLNANSPVIAQPGQPLSLSSTGLIIGSISFTHIRRSGAASANAADYVGNIEVQFLPASLARPFKPVRISQTVSVDLTSGSPAARPILSCTSGCETDTIDTGFSCVSKSVKDLTSYGGGPMAPYDVWQTRAISSCYENGRRLADLNDLAALCKVQPSGPMTPPTCVPGPPQVCTPSTTPSPNRFWIDGAKSSAQGCGSTNLNLGIPSSENNKDVLCAYTKTAPL
jgi:hypothetical protein